ncbi:DUF883 family protein [Propionivibrio limicola]|uniref:DUF883 family protein n=1 Tax=Propionivibrio limicola TaxID=167645 RepID=UPI0012910AF2|nr:DUF883 family protein [Propionivibrio limicola]
MTTELMTNQGSVQDSKEALVRDLKRVVGDADDLLKEVGSASAEEFSAARARIEATLDQARSRLNAARIDAAQRVRYAADATNQYIRENPWKVVGVGVVAGLIAAFLISRR